MSKAVLFEDIVSPKYEFKSKQRSTDGSQVNMFNRVNSTNESRDHTIKQHDSIN